MSAESTSLYPTSRTQLQEQVENTKEQTGFRYKTIFKWRLQMIMEKSQSDQEEAALNDFEEIVTVLIDMEKNSTVVPWKQCNYEGLIKANMNTCML